jgi:MSHA pilin protein MshD
MCSSGRGFTLVEVIVLIVVISVAAAGVLLIFQNTVRRSADPQIYKQSLAIAEAMLDEVLLTSYDPAAGGGPPRANFNDVPDYNGFNTSPGGMTDIQGVAVPGLSDYNVSVTVTTDGTTALNDEGATLTAVSDSRRVTVTVTHASGVSIALDGYRLRYAGP